MTRSELQSLHERICNQARELQIRKNHDYAKESDIFRNFRRYGTFGVLVRLSDKLARLDSFEENNEFAVTDEKLEDTVMDIVNYATIYLAMKLDGKPMLSKVTDGPYCHCRKLAEFRVAPPEGRPNAEPQFFCGACAEELPMVMVARMTAMDKL